MAERLSRRRRRRRLWILAAVLVLLATLSTYLVLRAQGCLTPRLDVTVIVRNIATTSLDGLSIDQVDGAGHAIVPDVAPGATVTVRLTADDRFRQSRLDLVDDATGRLRLAARQLRGLIARDGRGGSLARGAGARLERRARSHTDSGADPGSWQPLRPD